MVVLSKVAHSKSRGFQSFLFQKFFQIQASKTKKKNPAKISAYPPPPPSRCTEPAGSPASSPPSLH